MLAMFEDIKHKQRFLLEMVEEIERTGTLTPECNTIFQTFNGSYVYVFEKTEKSIELSDDLPEELVEAINDSPIGAMLRRRNNEPARYKATVLSGGHGLRPSGEKAGENFYLNEEGGFSIDGKDCIDHPLVVGMSLKRRVGHINYIDTITET